MDEGGEIFERIYYNERIYSKLFTPIYRMKMSSIRTLQLLKTIIYTIGVLNIFLLQ